MSERTVTTQAELDQALADGVEFIDIRSERGVRIEVFGSASVRASDSASVSASDSASVRAFDSASVRAFDSASVSASDSASVRAFDSASVRAFDSASVSASDSASVRAFDSASVSASSHVAVHLHSGLATIDGGVIIDHTAIDQTDPATWCSYHGVTLTDGAATLYKAVRADLRSAHGFAYPIGQTVTCDDWLDEDTCGNGLHLSPTPTQAREYDYEATRFLECRAQLADLRPLTGGGTAKCKTARVEVVREVDEWIRPVAAAVEAGAR